MSVAKNLGSQGRIVFRSGCSLTNTIKGKGQFEKRDFSMPEGKL